MGNGAQKNRALKPDRGNEFPITQRGG